MDNLGFRIPIRNAKASFFRFTDQMSTDTIKTDVNSFYFIGGENKMNQTKGANSFGKWGWSIIIYSLLCYMISSFSCTDGVNLYPEAFSALRGWDVTTIMSMSTIAGWIGVVGVILFSQLTAKKGVRSVTTVSVIIMGAALILFACTTSLPLYLLSIVIINFIGGSVLLNSAPSTLINKWFPRKKNLAFGWATMGMPICSVALIPLMAAGFANIGPSLTYVIFGVAVMIFGIATKFWVKDSPEEIGMLPDNEEMTVDDKALLEKEKLEIKKAAGKYTIRSLFKDRNTWCIGIGFGLIWLTVVGIVSQLIPHLMIDCGYDQGRATMMLSIAAAIGIFGSYFWGWLDLKLNTKKASIVYGIWFIAALLLLVIPNSEAMNWISTVVVGIGIGGVGNLIPSLMGSCFGRHGYIYAARVISPINTIVRSCAFVVVSMILAQAGTYRSAYLFLMILAAVGTVMLFFVKVPKEV